MSPIQMDQVALESAIQNRRSKLESLIQTSFVVPSSLQEEIPFNQTRPIFDRAEYEQSRTAICILQLILILIFIAFAFECVSFVYDWCAPSTSANKYNTTDFDSSYVATEQHAISGLRLLGPEKTLKALVSADDPLGSPGVDKKFWAYESIRRTSEEARKRVYEDELDWPVM